MDIGSCLRLEVTDSMNHLMAACLPANKSMDLAIELGLTGTEISSTVNPTSCHHAIKECLKQGRNRVNISSGYEMKQVFDTAVQNNTINFPSPWDLQQQDTITDRTELELAQILFNHNEILKIETFFVCNMGFQSAEFRNLLSRPQDLVATYLAILEKWSNKMRLSGQNTVGHLVEAATQAGIEDDVLSQLKSIAIDTAQASEHMSLRSQQLSRLLSVSKKSTENLLRRRYIEEYSQLIVLPWLTDEEARDLDGEFIPLAFDKMVNSVRTTISMNKLLVQKMKDGITHARRVCIQGEAGGGKTTLTSKICLEWAKKSTNIEGLLEYEMVFIVKVALVRENDDFATYAQRECLPRDLFWDIDELQTKTLLIIIDGYDERRTANNFIQDLVARRLLTESTILLTTKMGGANEIIGNFDVKLNLKLLTEDDISKFIENFAHNRNIDQQYLMTQAKQHSYMELLGTPLYLWFYVLLLGDFSDDVDNVLCRTDFIATMLQGIRSRAATKGLEQRSIDTTLIHLRHYAYSCLRDDSLHVPQNPDLGDSMVKLGAVNMTTSRPKGKLEIVKCYKFANKYLAEFCASEHIMQHTSDEWLKMAAQIPELVSWDRRQRSLILPCMAGLCHKTNNEAAFVTLLLKFLPVQLTDDGQCFHLELSCLCEAKNPKSIVTVLLEKRKKFTYVISNQCSHYCVAGLSVLTKYTTLEHLTVQSCDYKPEAKIRTKRCLIASCSPEVAVAAIKAVTSQKLKEIQMHGLFLDHGQIDTVHKCISRCGFGVKVELEGIRPIGTTFSLQAAPKSGPDKRIHSLRLHRPNSSSISAAFLVQHWTSVQHMYMNGIELHNDNLTSLAKSISPIMNSGPTSLQLVELPDDGLVKLLHNLQATAYVNILRCFEVWCISDRDCRAVAEFSRKCTNLHCFQWRNRRVQNAGCEISKFEVSVSAMKQMWSSLFEHNTALNTVVVQEYATTYKNSEHGRNRKDRAFIETLQAKSASIRSGLQWGKITLVDSNNSAVVTDQDCTAVQRLLQNNVPTIERGNNSEIKKTFEPRRRSRNSNVSVLADYPLCPLNEMKNVVKNCV